MASFFVFSQQGQVDMVGPFQGWASLKTFAITYIFGASCLIFAGVLIKNIVSGGMRSGFRNFIRLHYVALVMFACAGAWFALFLNSYAVSPRYKLLLVPFFLFSVFYVLKLFLKSENFLRWGLAGAVIFSFFCSYGFLYPTLQGNNHVLLERSLEYRNDARVYIEVARRLEERFFEFTIGAPFIFAQALALPELGFVSQKFDVVIYEMRSTYGGIRNFEGLANMNIRKTVWIGQESGRPGYPIGPQDKILERIVIGNREADLFVGGSSIERMWRIVQQYSKKAVAGQ